MAKKEKQMGYETKMVLVSTNNRKAVGYCGVLATLELGKVAYGKLGVLIGQLRNQTKKELDSDIELMEEERTRIYTPEGNYQPDIEALSEEERKKKLKPSANSKKD